MDRGSLAALICSRLREVADAAAFQFHRSAPGIGHFVVDDLLPAAAAHAINDAFPTSGSMVSKRSLRERKSVQARMAACEPLIGEAVYAFHDPDVLALVSQITGLDQIEADPLLYAGGVSSMGPGDFLNPHLDNSHDKDRERWRALNLLYYATPDWPEEGGGNLELWPAGVDGPRTMIHSRFNRLAVMVTHGRSWHSVSPVTVDRVRTCVSNYYFSPVPMRASDTFHVTSFRGRPNQPVVDAVLRADTLARSAMRWIKPHGVGTLTHLNEPA